MKNKPERRSIVIPLISITVVIVAITVYLFTSQILKNRHISDSFLPDKSATVSGNYLKSNVSETGGYSSSQQSSDKGVGPIQNVQTGPIDQELASRGKQIFDEKCSQCHNLDAKEVGPPLRDVTTERTPEFIMNMILNPEGMEQQNDTIKKMVQQYNMRMPNTGLDSAQARATLEYLRSVAKK